MNTDIVAAAGAAHIFELQGDDRWIEVDKVSGTERAFFDTFGGAVAVDGSKLSIGAWSADTIEGAFLIDGGALYSFERAWPLSLEEESIFKDIRLITEVNKSEIKLVNEGSWSEQYKLSVLNLQGSKIWQEEIQLHESWQKSFEGLSPGVYIIRLAQDGKASKSWKWLR
ncbi:MAG: T9SS type A sorting domain-containing protein [Bacteroidota bacterium]